MKATIFRKPGDLNQLEYARVKTPIPGPGEVRVRVRACALNHLDIWVRQGLPGPAIPLPHISGSDISGVVDRLGPGVRNIRIGQPVIIAPGIGCGRCRECRKGHDNLCSHYQVMGYQRQGGYGEYTVAPATHLIKISNRFNFTEWAAVPLVFLTAWHMLITLAKIRRGETLLVHAAGSGIGSAAIQIARLSGAHVIATVGSDTKLKRALGLGAHAVLNYRKRPFEKSVLRLTHKKGVDVIFEHIGPETWPQNLICLGRGGRMVFCGSTSGAQTTLNIRSLFVKQQQLFGSYMGTLPELKKVMRLVSTGKLKPVVDSVFDLREAAQAQKKMLDRKQFGKIILKV